MKKVLDILSNTLQTIAGILFLFIFIINVAGIITRTFLNFSFLWVADVNTLSIAWMLALGMSVAIHKKGHIAIEFIRDKLPKNVKKVLEIVVTLIIIAFLISLIFSCNIHDIQAREYNTLKGRIIKQKEQETILCSYLPLLKPFII